MAKYKVLKEFYGGAEQQLFELGEVYDFTKKRADEVNEILTEALEEVKETETEKEEVKETKKQKKEK